jgi:tetratricopeptide (TPR) repeat protein
MAVKKLSRAVEQDVLNPLPRFVRGLCYSKLKKYDRAIRDFGQCCKLGKSDITDRTSAATALAYFNSGVAKSRSLNFDSAIQDFSEAILLDKNEEDFYRNRALLYRRNGDYKLAQKDYQSVQGILEKQDKPPTEDDMEEEVSKASKGEERSDEALRKLFHLS